MQFTGVGISRPDGMRLFQEMRVPFSDSFLISWIVRISTLRSFLRAWDDLPVQQTALAQNVDAP
jgi:hypothetical protein